MLAPARAGGATWRRAWPRLFKALHGDLPVELRYESDAQVAAAGDEAEVREALLQGLVRHRAVDERRRFTGFGPHTDDLAIRLSGRLAREHASQGQLRSLVLALKLAELANVEQRRGDAPVLLLDDVPSELDPERRRFLFEMIASLSCQTLDLGRRSGRDPSAQRARRFPDCGGTGQPRVTARESRSVTEIAKDSRGTAVDKRLSPFTAWG